METGESVIPVADFDIRKPDFKKDQERRLVSVFVSSIESPLFDGYRELYDKNKDFYGLKIFTPNKEHPDEKIYFRQSRNGVAVFQKLRETEMGTFSGDIKVLDRESKKLFSVESLRYLVDNTKDRTAIFYKNKMFGSSSFSVDETGGIVTWNESEAQMKLVDMKFGKGSGVFFSLLGLFHEFGHRFQFKPIAPDEEIRPSAKVLKKESRFLDEKSIIGSDRLMMGRQVIKEEERNAWAFALALTSKLKHLGMDITRGLTSEQISKGVDYCLQTYDRSLNRIPGNPISNRERRGLIK